MIDPNELLDNFIVLLRQIPELAAMLGATEENITEKIYAYIDEFPQRSSLSQALIEMPTGSVMVAWQGTHPTRRASMDIWAHEFDVFVRSPEITSGSTFTYFAFFRAITKGKPGAADADIPDMLNTTVHDSCYPMNPPSIDRDVDRELLDYFKVRVSFDEAGDD